MPTTLDEVTTGAINGTGAFDVIMQAMEKHLQLEFQRGRLTGPDYSKVYLGAIKSGLQFGLKFTFEKHQSDLLEKQVLLADKELLIKDKEGLILDQQLLIAEKDNNLKQAQINKTEKEIEVLENQKSKIDAEKLLLEEKRITESAQTTTGIAAADSILGRQATLYQRQADGFIRDAEQKATKMMVDTWMLRRSTNETTPADAQNKLDDPNVGAAVTKLLQGVDVTVL